MKRILVISWFYPPVNSSEGLVTFKLLNNSRYEYDVFTQDSSTDWSYGRNVVLKNHANVRSIFAKSKYIVDWKEEAYQYFKGHRQEYDCIMTRSMPQESHEVGLRIKKEFPQIKWIASFGDPVKDNPYQHINCSLHSPYGMDNLINRHKSTRYRLSPKRMALSAYWTIRHRDCVRIRKELARIENETMLLADKIILNNESQKRYMASDAQTAAKTVVIHHSYDPGFYPKAVAEANQKLRFLFLGHLDVIRTAYPLLQAIKDLKEDVPDLAEHAEFAFYGDMADSDLVFVVKNDLLDVVKFHKPISYLESLEEMQNADWLVHIDGNIGLVSDENIFFAAKVADYFGSGTNILAITMPEGDIADILRSANELVLSFSANEIKEYLYLIICQGYQITPNRDYIAQFAAKAVAAEFDAKVLGEYYDA